MALRPLKRQLWLCAISEAQKTDEWEFCVWVNLGFGNCWRDGAGTMSLYVFGVGRSLYGSSAHGAVLGFVIMMKCNLLKNRRKESQRTSLGPGLRTPLKLIDVL
jgi:hypothetical protein